MGAFLVPLVLRCRRSAWVWADGKPSPIGCVNVFEPSHPFPLPHPYVYSLFHPTHPRYVLHPAKGQGSKEHRFALAVAPGHGGRGQPGALAGGAECLLHGAEKGK